jgi:acyl carrier protein
MKAANHKWSAEGLEDWLVDKIAQLRQVAPDSIDPDAPFASLDLDSVQVMELVVALEELLDFEIESTIAWDYPTVRLLSAYIATLAARQQSAAAMQGEPPC